ncbi:Short chain oxidoreductase protein [Lasiodiplodia theobromae]|uniref:Short chain oxidoreductase protein n=1 Tax=Lasiodiplodia theobromae TaxID=45133 RepID=UPI0015C33573|nr:Short chain oxidoreductase protein [Lasiodiplodia theobromae]KAF4540697.1 Short chain oxidoreductase protein [Lasiodiplodia theobromae]
MASTYLVTGSSRGIGLAIVTALAAKPATEVSKVFASARTETDSLKQLIAKSGGRVEWVALDVTSQESAKSAANKVAESLGGNGLDVLINNAGLGAKWNKTEDMTDLEDIFKINVLGVQYTTSAFLPLLKKGNAKKIIVVSTPLGSINSAPEWKWAQVPAYKISKAAVNMLTVQYALDLEDEGFTVVPLSPGYVKTDMGGGNGDLTPEESVKAVLDIVFRVTRADNGKFYNVKVPGWEHEKKYQGENLPW